MVITEPDDAGGSDLTVEEGTVRWRWEGLCAFYEKGGCLATWRSYCCQATAVENHSTLPNAKEGAATFRQGPAHDTRTQTHTQAQCSSTVEGQGGA